MSKFEGWQFVDSAKFKQHTNSVTGATVTTATADLIASTEINGARGFFGVDNATGPQAITVYPQVSADGSTWYEMDNGSGTAVANGAKRPIPWVGSYKFVRIRAATGSSTSTVSAQLYLSTV